MELRRSNERGRANHGWLDSRHTFSFANYYDPEHMGFRSLRVINEDRVQPGQGFGTHGHRDMEIISYVLEGALQHRDSMGNGSVIRPGDVQKMSAGTGVLHSEMNASRESPVHFLQIWVIPDRVGVEPGYEQKYFSEEDRRDRWRLLLSPDAAEGSLPIHADARVYGAVLSPGASLRHPVETGRGAWLQVARGEVEANGARLDAGDGASFSGGEVVEVAAVEPAELLLFDLA